MSEPTFAVCMFMLMVLACIGGLFFGAQVFIIGICAAGVPFSIWLLGSAIKGIIIELRKQP